MTEFDNLDNREIPRNTQSIKTNWRRNRKSGQIYNKQWDWIITQNTPVVGWIITHPLVPYFQILKS